MIERENKWANTTFWVLWVMVVALYLAWPLTHLQAYAWSNDEGLYVQRAALANAGYSLYTEIALNKPPLLVWILQFAFRLGGQTLAVARLTSLSLALMGVIALAALTSRLWGRWAGLAAAWVLLGVPEIPVRVAAVMSDLPAMAFALVALWAALCFRCAQKRVWILLSGAAYAAALLIHPLLIYMALPLAAISFLPNLGQNAGEPGQTKWQDVILFVSVVAGLGLIVLAMVDRQSFLTWVVEHNVESLSTNVEFAGPGKGQAIKYLKERWTLVWLAITGVVTLCTSPHWKQSVRWKSHELQGLVVAVVWFVATAAIIVTWSPVWNHYMVFLALPLAVVAGGGLAQAGGWIIKAHREKRRATWWHTTLVAVTLVGAFIFVFARSEESMPQPEKGPEWSPDRLAAQAFLEDTVPPDGFVVTDDPLLAFSADRLVPPALTEASYRQIALGYLTSDDLVVSVLNYRAQAVLFATGRLALLPAFENWVAAVATRRQDFGSLRAYRVNEVLAPHIQTTASHFAAGITLEGYALSSDELRPGEPFTLTLYWKRTAPIANDYTVFVHLVDQDGHVWGQHDGPPLMGAYPTSHWIEGLLLPDPHPLAVSSETLPGQYRVLTGMYSWPSLERLPAFHPDGSRWLNDLVILTALDLEEGQ